MRSVSGTIVDQDHFDMSEISHPPAPPPRICRRDRQRFPYENGGNRDRSDFHDWRLNTKVGITPNATRRVQHQLHERRKARRMPRCTSIDRSCRAISYGNNVRYWTGRNGIRSSVSWLSKTKLGDASYIKTNAYYNTFENTVSFFNRRLHQSTDDSPYDDHSEAASSRWAPTSYR